MLHASTQKLIVKLCELTAQGGIQWRHGKDGATVFETEGYVVEATAQPALFRVLGSDGSELERADAEALAAAPWPEGGSFADHVSAMAAQADRFARGADQAISRILSSLSPPPAADPIDKAVTATPQIAAQPAETLAASADAPIEAPETPASTTFAIEHFKRSPEVFGRTRSFAAASRTHHRSTPAARPVSSIGKITASGLLLAMPDTPELSNDRQQSPLPDAAPSSAVPGATPETPRPAPEAVPPDAYKPWN